MSIGREDYVEKPDSEEFDSDDMDNPEQFEEGNYAV